MSPVEYDNHNIRSTHKGRCFQAILSKNLLLLYLELKSINDNFKLENGTINVPELCLYVYVNKYMSEKPKFVAGILHYYDNNVK